ncbi:MAG: proprotein convertase P-domain-containing protein [Ignavibacteria bacterium]|nr:proprotein convertase P-domain-containing protein [Ignavibacteria bacterium]
MKKCYNSVLICFIFTLLMPSSKAFSQMFWNQTAKFTGASLNYSYVSVPNLTSLNLTGSFSAEAWVNPTSYSGIIRGIIAKGSTLGTSLRYAVRITTAGRITVNTNGSQRLISRNSNIIPLNKWTHVSTTYNSSSGDFKIYINGILDTSSIVAGAAPLSNTDSLFIGISGGSTHWNGELDEVRLWNRELSSSEVIQNMRTSLGTSTGIYQGLVLSMPFQKENSEGTRFTVRDLSGNGNNGNSRNVTAIDQSFRPLQTLSQNNNIELDGDEDYLAAKDTSTLDPTGFFITLECWVYPRTSNQTCNLITKGNQYALILENGILKVKINGSTASSNVNIPANEWTKLTMQYHGVPQFHINGKYRNGAQPFLGNLVLGTDSLYVGGVPGATGDFNGFMDEIRIFDHHFSDDGIYNMTFNSIEKANVPPEGDVNICYNLDGSLADNAESGGPKLNFRNNAKFSNPGSTLYKPVSPLIRDPAGSFPKGFYQGEENHRIPLSSGSSGTSTYQQKINLDTVINDIDVMIALNHTNLSSLNITVIAPNNDSVLIVSNLSSSTADNSLVTIFDDQADSAFASGRYVSFHTTMKPQNNMNSVFAGDRSLGVWKIRINDLAAGDTGVLNMCGIKINHMPVIENNFFLSNYIQGLYNPATNFTVKDTITMYLRKKFSPYEIVDSCKREMNQTGQSQMSFKNVIADTLYTLSLKHRNSIEIWSNIIVLFKYSFSVTSFQLSAIVSTFGGNEIQVDDDPVRFAMFSGDVDQNGFIDLGDVISISNKANEFAAGFIVQDLTGNNLADLNDVLLAYNNSINFVQKKTPLD